MNALWRGTFGHYLFELWNPPISATTTANASSRRATLYDTRWYAVALFPAVRRAAAAPRRQAALRHPADRRQALRTSGSAVESRIGALLGVLRPMWELATGLVPTMTDGDVEKAKDDHSDGAVVAGREVPRQGREQGDVRDPEPVQRSAAVETRRPSSTAAGGGRHQRNTTLAHIYNCNDFLPDPPYEAGTLVGVPWVLADAKDPKKEADDHLSLDDNNYLKQIAKVVDPDA